MVHIERLWCRYASVNSYLWVNSEITKRPLEQVGARTSTHLPHISHTSNPHLNCGVFTTPTLPTHKFKKIYMCAYARTHAPVDGYATHATCTCIRKVENHVWEV